MTKIHDELEAHVAKLFEKSACTVAHTLENRVLIHPGFGSFQIGPEGKLKVFGTDSLRELADEAERLGLRVYIEVYPEEKP